MRPDSVVGAHRGALRLHTERGFIMSNYRITYRSVELRTARIDAESESAARQAWIDGDVDDSELVETVEEHIERVEELS